MTLSHHVHNPTVYEYDMWTITDNSACWKALVKWIEKSQRELSYICWKPDLTFFIQHLIPFFHSEANAWLFKNSSAICCHKNVCDLWLKILKCIRGFMKKKVLLFNGCIFLFFQGLFSHLALIWFILMPETIHSLCVKKHTLKSWVFIVDKKIHSCIPSSQRSTWKLHWVQIKLICNRSNPLSFISHIVDASAGHYLLPTSSSSPGSFVTCSLIQKLAKC